MMAPTVWHLPKPLCSFDRRTTFGENEAIVPTITAPSAQLEKLAPLTEARMFNTLANEAIFLYVINLLKEFSLLFLTSCHSYLHVAIIYLCRYFKIVTASNLENLVHRTAFRIYLLHISYILFAVHSKISYYIQFVKKATINCFQHTFAQIFV